MQNSTQYILQISCPDQKGLIAATTNILHLSGANIIDLTQHTATDIDRFFLRAVFDCPQSLSEEVIKAHVGALATQYQMDWQLKNSSQKEQVAIFVSKTDHCLHELLFSHRDGLLPCEFAAVISNHEDCRIIAERADIPYYLIPAKGDRAEREAQMETILQQEKISTIVLARYMQILTGDFTRRWNNKIINIHHGFLPAFKGAKPYHQAWEKGVKLIGATAHFATEDLDQGPIICQNVINIPETASINDFIQSGKDIERRTLVEALKLYLEHRVFAFNNRTFIL